MLEEIARQLRQVGLTLSIRAMDKTAFFSLAGSGRNTDAPHGLVEMADAGDALDALAHSKDATGIGSDNDLDLSDLELDRLIEAANASTSAEDRVRRLQAALRRFHQQKVYLPLYVQPESVLVEPAGLHARSELRARPLGPATGRPGVLGVLRPHGLLDLLLEVLQVVGLVQPAHPEQALVVA